jgi:hypothetical protein
VLGQPTRTEGNAPFALAPTRAEAGVPLERLDVVVTTGNGFLELVHGDVFAATGENFAHG